MTEKGTAYLPDNATCIIIQEIVNLRISFDDLARKMLFLEEENLWLRFTQTTLYSIHTMDNKYHADKIKDKDDDGGCNKDYNESPTKTGGLTHITYAQY